MVRNRVEELRTTVLGDRSLEALDVQPLFVHRHVPDGRLEALERHDGSQIRRSFDEDEITGVQQALAKELESLDRSARDDELVVVRPSSIEFQSIRDERPGAGQPGYGCVLKGRDVASRCEAIEVFGECRTGKRRWVGKATGERDEVGLIRKGQDRGQTVGRACLRPASE
jgi:hypothetical protein